MSGNSEDAFISSFHFCRAISLVRSPTNHITHSLSHQLEMRSAKHEASLPAVPFPKSIKSEQNHSNSVP